MSLFEGLKQFKVPLSQYKNYSSYVLNTYIGPLHYFSLSLLAHRQTECSIEMFSHTAAAFWQQEGIKHK